MKPVSCDIFCAVIDNFGDAGVCWRLARQLVSEHGWQVRLWIDDPAPIDMLAPGQEGVEVCRWSGSFADVEPAAVVIEAFACKLPPAYTVAMKDRKPQPVWINLEYLSAEAWVPGCHGLPSPQSGLNKHFFFPGFVPGTGGLLRDRENATLPAPTISTFSGPLEISLFCYQNPALPELLDAWQDGDRQITCHVCDGMPRHQAAAWLGEDLPVGRPVRRGKLTLCALPFLPQREYDALLDRCHLNFVRGEDSFVRAQWAQRPFVWQAYPQADNAHLTKLDAFLDLYTGNEATRNFFHAWNSDGLLDWPAFAASLADLATNAPVWTRRIGAQGDLATNLAKMCTEFCAVRL